MSERIKDERAYSIEVLITLMGVLRHPLITQPHLKAASSGEHHTELGADFYLLHLPRPSLIYLAPCLIPFTKVPTLPPAVYYIQQTPYPALSHHRHLLSKVSFT